MKVHVTESRIEYLKLVTHLFDFFQSQQSWSFNFDHFIIKLCVLRPCKLVHIFFVLHFFLLFLFFLWFFHHFFKLLVLLEKLLNLIQLILIAHFLILFDILIFAFAIQYHRHFFIEGERGRSFEFDVQWSGWLHEYLSLFFFFLRTDCFHYLYIL